MASSHRKTILTISRDRPLQRTRTLMLECAGYAVVETGPEMGVLSFLAAAEGVDLIVMCHSVPRRYREMLAKAIKAVHPEAVILMLCPHWECDVAEVDAFLDSRQSSPDSLLSTVQRLSGPARRDAPAFG